MDHRTAKILNAPECGGKIRHREIWERGVVAGARPTLVEPQTEVGAVDLPAGACIARPWRKLGAEHAAPKPLGAFGIVRREFDQRGRQANRPPRLEGQPPSMRRSRPRPRPPPGAGSLSSGWPVGRGKWRRAPPDLPCAWRARPVAPQVELRTGDAPSRSSDRESPRSRAAPRSTPPRAREIALRRGAPPQTSRSSISPTAAGFHAKALPLRAKGPRQRALGAS
jgi:hypothetical protein